MNLFRVRPCPGGFTRTAGQDGGDHGLDKKVKVQISETEFSHLYGAYADEKMI